MIGNRFHKLTSAKICGEWVFEIVEVGLVVVVRIGWLTRFCWGLVIVVDNEREDLSNSRIWLLIKIKLD